MRLLLVATALLAVATAYNCIQCNTGNPKELDCADAIDPTILNKYSKPCVANPDSIFKGKAAVGCRKTYQKVSQVADEWRIVRECAFSGENVDGQRKTGNKGILLFHYQCTNESPAKPCNGVAGISIFTASIVALVARFL